jgi:hypothetical protein
MPQTHQLRTPRERLHEMVRYAALTAPYFCTTFVLYLIHIP